MVLALLENPDQGLFGEDPLAARDALLADALKDSRTELERRLGPDPSQWTWGRLHAMHFRHPLDRQTGAGELLDLEPLPRPGDEYTVNATGFDAWTSWEQTEGASYREIIDTGDWDRSVAVNTPGQSGQPGSAHYADLVPLWNAGRYFPLIYTREAVERNPRDRLRLLP